MPFVFGTDDPTLLGLGWGAYATWWVGLVLGVPLAIAARAGSRPMRDVKSLVRPIAILMAVMAGCAIVAGTIGGLLAATGMVILVGPLADAVPADKHVAFLIDGWAHSASYFVGFVGGIAVIAKVWRSRKNPQDSRTHPGA